MTIELKPDQEKIIREQLASGRYRSVDEVLDTALSNLPHGEDSTFNARRPDGRGALAKKTLRSCSQNPRSRV